MTAQMSLNLAYHSGYEIHVDHEDAGLAWASTARIVTVDVHEIDADRIQLLATEARDLASHLIAAADAADAIEASS